MDNQGAADKTVGVVAAVAEPIVAVMVARVDSRGIHNRDPRVRSIIGDSITTAPGGRGQQSEATMTVTMCN